MDSHHIDRRSLLAGLVATPLITSGQAYATPPSTGSRLLIIFLRGAYDALNVVAPTGSSFYQESRPTIALPRPDPSNPDAATRLDADWSLHPALADPLMPLWARRQLAFIPFAGIDDSSRSHFLTQNLIELGLADSGQRSASGFMARIADAVGADRRPIAFTKNLPACFRGARHPVSNLPLSGFGRPIGSTQAQLIARMYERHPVLQSAVTDGFALQKTISDRLRYEMEATSDGAMPARGFELIARRVGNLMRDEYGLAFLDVGGWDTHVNQGGASGYLANQLAQFGGGLRAFIDAIGPDVWGKTTVLVISEFGRTFRENGDRGTDHGHGTTYWVLGGALSGGRLAGEQIALSEKTLYQARDLPVLNGYRQIIGGLLMRQFALDSVDLDKIFPGVKSQDLKLL